MAIRWAEFPHDEMRVKIYARVGANTIGRSAEDSLRYSLQRRLGSLDPEDHRRFIELEAHYIIELLRSIREVYREFVETHDCRPLIEAYWVVLRFAVFPTAIEVVQEKIVNYLKLSRVRAQDLSLLFGIPTHNSARDSNTDSRFSEVVSFWGFQCGPPNLNDETPATDGELVALAKLINVDTLLCFDDIREGGGGGRPLGGGPFALDDRQSIERSWTLCALPAQITLDDWIRIREKLWHKSSPWTDEVLNLYSCVQEELLSQSRAIAPDTQAYELMLNDHRGNLREIVVPAETRLPLGLRQGQEREVPDREGAPVNDVSRSADIEIISFVRNKAGFFPADRDFSDATLLNTRETFLSTMDQIRIVVLASWQKMSHQTLKRRFSDTALGKVAGENEWQGWIDDFSGGTTANNATLVFLEKLTGIQRETLESRLSRARAMRKTTE